MSSGIEPGKNSEKGGAGIAASPLYHTRVIRTFFRAVCPDAL